MNTLALPDRISDLMAYQNERVLRRYELDHHTDSTEAQRRFEGLKQFLLVCAATPGYKVTSDAIDSMWHTFLLFTKDYKDFCTQYFGKFINHEPFEIPSPEAYVKTREHVREMFGDLDVDLWPVDAKIECSSGCGD